MKWSKQWRSWTGTQGIRGVHWEVYNRCIYGLNMAIVTRHFHTNRIGHDFVVFTIESHSHDPKESSYLNV